MALQPAILPLRRLRQEASMANLDCTVRICLKSQASKQTEGSRGSGFHIPSYFAIGYLPPTGTRYLQSMSSLSHMHRT